MHFYAFRCLYLTCDYWNLVDLTLIMATMALVILDVVGTDENLAKVTRIRGLFRILRIVLLIRKVGALTRIQELDKLYEAQSRCTEDETYELRTPIERVLFILRSLKSKIDGSSEAKLIEDLSYCLRIIASNNLYDAELVVRGSAGNEMFRMNNEQMEKALSKPCQPDGPVASELSIKSSQTNGQLAQLAKR
jgi:signal transduction histidine kinase